MNATEFINQCDLEGGLKEFFDYGFQPTELEPTVDSKLRDVICCAYKHWQEYKEYEDQYYTLVETGEY